MAKVSFCIFPVTFTLSAAIQQLLFKISHTASHHNWHQITRAEHAVMKMTIPPQRSAALTNIAARPTQALPNQA